jgi:hypothetical protein
MTKKEFAEILRNEVRDRRDALRIAWQLDPLPVDESDDDADESKDSRTFDKVGDGAH